MPAVEVLSLAHRYGSTVALDDVTWAAPADAVTAVLGPNGAGKTTSVEICCGLRRADAGSVRVLGLDPAADAGRLRQRVGVMPQAAGSSAAGVYPAARVRDTLRLYADLYAHPLSVDDLLDRLDLTRVARSPWRALSGGEQQRLSLALALVGRPEVVFLDEPTAGLDVAGRQAVWTLLADLRGAGVAVVLTTHAMDEVERLADHVVLLAAGRVVAQGAPGALTRGAASAERLRFGGPPGLAVAELAAALPVGSTVSEPAPGRYLVEGTVDPALVAAVTAWCAAQGVLADSLEVGGRSLEDVYLQLTQRAERS